jgi:hypothetical protein
VTVDDGDDDDDDAFSKFSDFFSRKFLNSKEGLALCSGLYGN